MKPLVSLVALFTVAASAATAQVAPAGSHDRSRNLALVTLDARDTGVADILEVLRGQTGHDLATGGPWEELLSRRVSFHSEGEPLTAVLHRLGVTPSKSKNDFQHLLTPESLQPLRDDAVWRTVPGASFAFTTEPWEATARGPGGTILRTAVTLDAHGAVTWDLVHAAGKGFDGLETCRSHSPRAVLLTGEGEGPIEVVVEGSVWWYRSYKVVFDRPEPGASLTVEDIRVSVEWPYVVATPPRPLPYPAIPVIKGVDFTLVDETKRPKSGGGAFGGGRRPLRKPDWCGCRGPRKELAAIRNLHRFEDRHLVVSTPTVRDGSFVDQEILTLFDVLRLEVSLRVPVEEPFRVGALLSIE
jgi:hypothetical protein